MQTLSSRPIVIQKMSSEDNKHSPVDHGDSEDSAIPWCYRLAIQSSPGRHQGPSPWNHLPVLKTILHLHLERKAPTHTLLSLPSSLLLASSRLLVYVIFFFHLQDHNSRNKSATMSYLAKAFCDFNCCNMQRCIV